MGRSGCAVAKYFKLDGTPKIVKHTFQEVVRNKSENNAKRYLDCSKWGECFCVMISDERVTTPAEIRSRVIAVNNFLFIAIVPADALIELINERADVSCAKRETSTPTK